MFRKACREARHFTLPIVTSHRGVKGECGSGIATYIPINSDGWIITAWHVFHMMAQLTKQAGEVASYKKAVAEIKSDASLSSKDKKIKIDRLGKLNQNAVENTSIWAGIDGVQIVDIQGIEAVDLAVGRLTPFDPKWVARYPKIKDSARDADDFHPGASLCRLGYPFHEIKSKFNEATGMFEFEPGAVPLPLFPIEGILTRIFEIGTFQGENNSYPLRLIETSAPGLRGQSGGPIFDTDGVIGGMQTRTVHQELGFSPKIKNATEHQFINLGQGVHADTIIGTLRNLGLRFEVE